MAWILNGIPILTSVVPLAQLFSIEVSPSQEPDKTGSEPEQTGFRQQVLDSNSRIQELELHPPPRIATVVSTVAR